MTAEFIDMTGQKFGRWTVLSHAGSVKGGKSTWNCRCECGEARVVLGYSMRIGNSKSCGCLKNDRLSFFKKEDGIHRRPSAEALREAYLDRGMSTADLADSYGCSPETVRQWLIAAKIPIRTQSEAMKLLIDKNPGFLDDAIKNACASHASAGYQNLKNGRSASAAKGYPGLKKSWIKRRAAGFRTYHCQQCDALIKGVKSQPRKFCSRACVSLSRRSDSCNAPTVLTPTQPEALPQWLRDITTKFPHLTETGAQEAELRESYRTANY